LTKNQKEPGVFEKNYNMIRWRLDERQQWTFFLLAHSSFQTEETTSKQDTKQADSTRKRNVAQQDGRREVTPFEITIVNDGPRRPTKPSPKRRDTLLPSRQKCAAEVRI
jgi:hypothetical protein